MNAPVHVIYISHDYVKERSRYVVTGLDMKALVCGGRNFSDQNVIEESLAYLHDRRRLTVILHGDATGADTLSKNWALENGVWTLACPSLADGPRSNGGVLRYQFMMDFFEPDLVIAFPGGEGTKRMVEMAQSKSIPVWRAVLA